MNSILRSALVDGASTEMKPASAATIAKSRFPVGTVVWCKVSSYPYWPARVISMNDINESKTRRLLEKSRTKSQMRSKNDGSDMILVQFFKEDNFSFARPDRVQRFVLGQHSPDHPRKGVDPQAITLAEAAVRDAPTADV